MSNKTIRPACVLQWLFYGEWTLLRQRLRLWWRLGGVMALVMSLISGTRVALLG